MLDSAPSADEDIPLVVDLDGTLLRSDLLVESFFSLLASKPLAGLASVFKLAAGRAALKAHLAERAPLDIDTLPLDSAVLDHLRREKANGRRLYLASAADRRYVERLADKLAIFDGTFGSSPTLKSFRPRQGGCALLGVRREGLRLYRQWASRSRSMATMPPAGRRECAAEPVSSLARYPP